MIDHKGHWPMETDISPAALDHVERAVRAHLLVCRSNAHIGSDTLTELENLANLIRSHLQHVVERGRSETRTLSGGPGNFQNLPRKAEPIDPLLA